MSDNENELESGKKNKGKSIDAVLKEIQKKFSKTNPDIVFDPNKGYEVLSSGCLMYDIVSGIGGFPKGRITEVCAFESVGKSSLLLSTMGLAQQQGKICVLFDHEQCFDPWYAENCYGLKADQKTFFLFQPTSIEEGDSIFDMLMETNVPFDIIAWDSIACMIPASMSEASLSDSTQIGLHARFISRVLHKVKKECYARNFAAVFTNQFKFQIQRDQYTPGVGVATGYTYKDQFTTPGGLTPRFLASIRMKMDTSGRQEESNVKDPITGEVGDMKTTKLIKIINIKNKCSRPELKGVAHFDLVTPTQKGGWNSKKDLMELLRFRGRITQSGATFKYQGISQEWTFRGKANGEQAFLNTPEILQDAFALLDQLRKEESSGTLLVDRAVIGVDISESERSAQKETIPVEGELPSLTIPPVNSGDTTL